jgi:hypothetical protein
MKLTLLQLSQHIDDLFDAIQYAIQGKLPIKLISPLALQSILRNVTLELSEGYELIAGTSLDNIHLYYDLTRVSVVFNAHSISLVLNVPLKPANRHFTLFKIIALPIRISSDKYFQYVIDHSYLGVQHSQQAYVLLTETDFNRKKSSFTVCPADIAVYQAQALMCDLVYISRKQILTIYVDDNSFSTKTRHFYIVTDRYGYFISQQGISLLCTAPESTKGCLAIYSLKQQD